MLHENLVFSTLMMEERVNETTFENVVQIHIKELSQDSVVRFACALPLNLLKSMTNDFDLNVTQVQHKLQTNTGIYKHAKYQVDPSSYSRDIDL